MPFGYDIIINEKESMTGGRYGTSGTALFLTLARENNISRAAEALFITQPTLSRQLAELEEELGVKLFERGKRKITLTEDGMLLRRRAEEMIELEDKVEREFRQRNDNLSGVISIGAAETKAVEILPKLITSFREKYPAVTFDIQSDIATSVKEGIDRGVLDIGLVIEPGDIDKYNFIPLGIDDRCGILMSTQSPLAQKEYVTVNDLVGLPVIANKRASVQSFYRSALGETYDKLNVIATHNSSTTRRILPAKISAMCSPSRARSTATTITAPVSAPFIRRYANRPLSSGKSISRWRVRSKNSRKRSQCFSGMMIDTKQVFYICARNAYNRSARGKEPIALLFF